jgi:hypothetical protein
VEGLVDKIRKIEKEISEERGDFKLFALFLREDAIDNWDLVVSSDWTYSNKADALRYISNKVDRNLSNEEKTKISRIVIVDPNNPSIKSINRKHNILHSLSEEKNTTYFDQEIDTALIISSS